jgi:hypothetical protein
LYEKYVYYDSEEEADGCVFCITKIIEDELGVDFGEFSLNVCYHEYDEKLLFFLSLTPPTCELKLEGLTDLFTDRFNDVARKLFVSEDDIGSGVKVCCESTN